MRIEIAISISQPSDNDDDMMMIYGKYNIYNHITCLIN